MKRRLRLVILVLFALPAFADAQFPPDTCRQGYVWREAFPDDHVCVKPEVREQAAVDNSQAADREPPEGSLGPDTCRQGFVWRDAFPGDHVCVTPQTRDQAARDNLEAESRRLPSTGHYGSPYICREPYVWRLARPGDFVCVTRETRAQTQADNRQAAARRGADTCKSGYVWRQARPEDYVCVTPETRAQAASDNQYASERTVKACETYAHTGVSQYAQAGYQQTTYGRCGMETDRRWHYSYQDHYNWCITVDPAQSSSEEQARAAHLASCTSTSGGGRPGKSPSGAPRCCWLPAAGPNGSIYVSYQCGPQCP